VRRMSSILKEFQGESSCDGTSFPKCICYCLSPGKCKKAVNEFAIQRISATEFSSSTENDIALQRFQSGDVQVLCATSALGRGVQIDCPVRYIFHLVLPTSLAGALFHCLLH
jgi:superfamily II DNA helicase RecQ